MVPRVLCLLSAVLVAVGCVVVVSCGERPDPASDLDQKHQLDGRNEDEEQEELAHARDDRTSSPALREL